MINTNRTTKNSEFRTCTCCGKIYPNTRDFFNVNNKTGLNSVCKACSSKKNKERNEKLKMRFDNTNIEYDDEKTCKKCGRSLPNSYRFFPIDKTCKTGLRNVCRECNSGNFLSENYESPKNWTIEDDEIMLRYYKDYTGRELQEKFFPNRSIRAIESRGNILGVSGKTEETFLRSCETRAVITSEKLTGRIFTDEQRKKMSETKKEYFKTHQSWWLGRKRSEEQRKQISERMKGKWAGDKNPRHLYPLNGADNGRWKGGISQTYTELRSDTKDWQTASMSFCGYLCIISGGEFDNIHHIVSFRDIVDEVFDNTGLDIKERVMDYSDEEFELLRSETKKLHSLYGFGACIQKDIHKLFHDVYGYTQFSPYDFLDFIYAIDIGDYDEWFNQHNLQIKINYGYVEYLENILQEIKCA